MENPIYKWMIWGTPILGNHHIDNDRLLLPAPFVDHHIPDHWADCPRLLNSMDWFKGKSTPETIDFPIKYGA